MSETRRRRFWQIHLSTAVVLTFMMSLLIWANVFNWPAERYTKEFVIEKVEYGWPEPFYT